MTTHEDTALTKPDYDYSDVGPNTGACNEETKPTFLNVQEVREFIDYSFDGNIM